jgi:hypothetical protein
MKHLKSRSQDLLRLFQHSITVKELAEPLVSFDADIPSKKVLAFMKERDFDVVGVRTDGVTTRFVERDSLGKGFLGKHAKDISKTHLLDESDPLDRAVQALKVSRWVFVCFLGCPSGIITRGDLQKAPLRMWLFGLISLLEMQLLRRIIEAYPNDSWAPYISEDRLEGAKAIQKDRTKRGAAIDLAECLQISDKASIYKKSATLYPLLPFKTKTDWISFTKKLESLRNKLAHSNPIPSGSWPQIAALVEDIRQCLEDLER